jgi:hypothetical protein
MGIRGNNNDNELIKGKPENEVLHRDRRGGNPTTTGEEKDQLLIIPNFSSFPFSLNNPNPRSRSFDDTSSSLISQRTTNFSRNTNRTLNFVGVNLEQLGDFGSVRRCVESRATDENDERVSRRRDREGRDTGEDELNRLRGGDFFVSDTFEGVFEFLRASRFTFRRRGRREVMVEENVVLSFTFDSTCSSTSESWVESIGSVRTSVNGKHWVIFVIRRRKGMLSLFIDERTSVAQSEIGRGRFGGTNDVKDCRGEVRVGGDELKEKAETGTIVGSSVEGKEDVRVVDRERAIRGRSRGCSFEEERDGAGGCKRESSQSLRSGRLS